MTLEECQSVCDEIAGQLDRVNRRMEEERSVDIRAVRDLRDYCLAQYPRFKGRFGNVGTKVLLLREAANRSIESLDTAPLNRGLAEIEGAISIHRHSIV